MHDKRQTTFDTPNPKDRTLESLIVELEVGDPAAAPDIADGIAARLEADLAAASPGISPSGVDDRSPLAEAAADTR